MVMRIGIESQRIFRVSKHGMDVVALELIREFQRLDTANQYTLFAREGPDRSCLSDSPNLTTRIVRGGSYADWEQLALPRVLRGSGLRLVHFTANTAPLRCPLPYLLTLHDIIYLEKTGRGGSAYQRFGNLYRRAVVPNAVRKANAIVTVSDFEKKIITEYFDLDPANITVVYNGVSERFHTIEDPYTKDNFRRRYQLPRQFLLFLGNTAPKKNASGMVKAYVHYCDIEKDPLPIVITDYRKLHVEGLLAGLGKTGLIDRFIFPGYIPSGEMPLLYNCCSLFLYPSLRESFGLPVLEAMACGIPVIASNSSAIPEVAGTAAKLVDPGDPGAIAVAIRDLLADRETQAAYQKKGLERAAGFTWEAAAKKLTELYRTVE